MKMEILENCWVIVDESSMILAASDYEMDDLEQHYKDTCSKIKTGDYEITIENIDGAQTVLIHDCVASIRIFTNADKTRAAFEEVLTFLKDEAEGGVEDET